MIYRWTSALSVVFITSLFAVACGDDEDDGDGATPKDAGADSSAGTGGGATVDGSADGTGGGDGSGGGDGAGGSEGASGGQSAAGGAGGGNGSSAVGFSGVVKLDARVTGGTGFLCIGVFASGCPQFSGALPEPIDGDDVGATTLETTGQEKPFSFEVDGLAPGTYGVAAMLQFGEGVASCDGEPASGDLIGCSEQKVAVGANVTAIEIVLDSAAP